MEIHNEFIQGSDEWLQFRLGKPSASNFSKIVTSKGELSKTLNDYALDLAKQTLVSEQEEMYKSADMQKGNDMEHFAREAYQEYSFNFVDEVGCITLNKDILYSPDGLIEKDGLFEAKCPKQKTHLKYLIDDKLPTKYVQQVQGGLYTSGRVWCDFVSYCIDFKKPERRLFCKRVYRDEEFISKLAYGLNIVKEKRDEILKKYRQIDE